MRRLFTLEDDRYIQEHYRSTSYKELAERFGVTERQLRGHINNMGWTKRIKKDDSFFSAIDTPQKSYWLGLMYADGYLSYRPEHRTYEAAIELWDEDLDTLLQLQSELGFDCKITHKEADKTFNGYTYHTSSNVLRMYSKRLCEDLIRHGVGVHKTYSQDYPIVDSYKAAFVRGFLDGDGCIYIPKNRHLAVHFTNANKGFLEYLNAMIYDECGASGHIYLEKENKYRLMYTSTHHVLLLLNWIYQDDGAWRFERKYQKYKTLCNGLAA